MTSCRTCSYIIIRWTEELYISIATYSAPSRNVFKCGIIGSSNWQLVTLIFAMKFIYRKITEHGLLSLLHCMVFLPVSQVSYDKNPYPLFHQLVGILTTFDCLPACIIIQ